MAPTSEPASAQRQRVYDMKRILNYELNGQGYTYSGIRKALSFAASHSSSNPLATS